MARGWKGSVSEVHCGRMDAGRPEVVRKDAHVAAQLLKRGSPTVSGGLNVGGRKWTV